MKTQLITLAIATLVASSAALACEDSVQRDSSTEVKNVHVAAVVRAPARDTTAPAGKTSDKAQLPETQTQQQPDPHYLPYVNNGWYGD